MFSESCRTNIVTYSVIIAKSIVDPDLVGRSFKIYEGTRFRKYYKKT